MRASFVLLFSVFDKALHKITVIVILSHVIASRLEVMTYKIFIYIMIYTTYFMLSKQKIIIQ